MKKKYHLGFPILLLCILCTSLTFAQYNLVSLSPTDDAVDVPSSRTTLEFVVAGNYANAGAGSVQIFNEDTNSLDQFIGNASGAISFNYDGSTNTTITVDLTVVGFSFGVGNYSVVVKEILFGGPDGPTLQANSGADYTTRTTWNFTTVASAAIGDLISLSPANGAVDVPADSDLVLVVKGDYSNALTGGTSIHTSLDPGTQVQFIGAGASGGANYSFVYDAGTGNTTITITPPNNFPIGFTAIIVQENIFGGTNGPDLKAISTFNYIEKVEWNFTTVPAIGSLISISPENGATNVDGDTDLEIVVKGNYAASGEGGIVIFDGTDTEVKFISGDTDAAAFTFTYDAGSGNTTIAVDTGVANFTFNADTYALVVKEKLFGGVDGPTLQANSGADYIVKADWGFTSNGTLSIDSVNKIDAKIFGRDGSVSVINANLQAIYNIIGQEVPNDNLAAGVYLVRITKGALMEVRKVLLN